MEDRDEQRWSWGAQWTADNSIKKQEKNKKENICVTDAAQYSYPPKVCNSETDLLIIQMVLLHVAEHISPIEFKEDSHPVNIPQSTWREFQCLQGAPLVYHYSL